MAGGNYGSWEDLAEVGTRTLGGLRCRGALVEQPAGLAGQQDRPSSEGFSWSLQPLFGADGLSSLLPQEPSTGGWWKVNEVLPEGAEAAQCPGELDTRPKEWQGVRVADRGPAPLFTVLCVSSRSIQRPNSSRWEERGQDWGWGWSRAEGVGLVLGAGREPAEEEELKTGGTVGSWRAKTISHLPFPG